ncbi:RNA recognition motif [Popillia japonica]|uniref:RNA recognition motif n=1 Tax=Popillia japonica TaxID=7064 RepID=A0AAW1KLY1_POPJA
MSRRSATTTKVFVGSLPADATPEDLKRLFAPYGAIAECDIANRCGFLHLEDKDLATKAIEELNNSTFMGVRISVEKGRVKPPNRSRGGRGGGGPMRGGKDRGGPYSRDGFGPRFGGRDYPPYPDRYDYERGGRGFDGYGERRPGGYDDRRMGSYMGDRERRPPYDDRPPYADLPRGGYDDRRMPPAGGFEERRPPMTDRRPLMDSGIGPGPREDLR